MLESLLNLYQSTTSIFTEFLIKTITRTVKITLSYLSWQSHEKYLNPILSTSLSFFFFVAILSLAL